MDDTLSMQEAEGAGEIPQDGGCGLLAVRAMSDEVLEQLEKQQQTEIKQQG